MFKNFQQGVAAIEVALVMPFIFILVLGGIDLARTVYQYNTLVKNLRDATKYVSSAVRPINYSVNGSTDPEVIKYKTIVTEAKNLALCGLTTACTNQSVDGLSLDNIQLSYPSPINGVTFVKIKITDFSLGFISNLFGNSLDLDDISLTMYQRQQGQTDEDDEDDEDD